MQVWGAVCGVLCLWLCPGSGSRGQGTGGMLCEPHWYRLEEFAKRPPLALCRDAGCIMRTGAVVHYPTSLIMFPVCSNVSATVQPRVDFPIWADFLLGLNKYFFSHGEGLVFWYCYEACKYKSAGVRTGSGRGGRIGRALVSDVGDRGFKLMTYNIDTCRFLAR